MSWKEFFRLTKVKLILLVLFLLFLIILFIYSKNIIHNDLETLACETINFNEEVNEARAQNDTQKIDSLIEEFQNRRYSLIDDKKLSLTFGSNIVIYKINPLYPIPCEVVETKFCSHYMSLEGYNCIKELSKSSSLSGLFDSGYKEYSPISYISLSFNIIIFIIFFSSIFIMDT